MTGRTAIANERRARERHGKEASRQTAAMPATANRQQPTPPTPRGRGNKPKQANWEEQARGGRAKEKRKSHIYIGAGRRYAFIPLNRNRGTGKQAAPRVCIERDGVDEKNRPRRSQRKEKTKERAGANTHRPYREKSSNGRENQRKQPTHHR